MTDVIFGVIIASLYNGEVPDAPKAHPPRAGRFIHMYYVYIIFSQRLNRFYIGYTQDLKDRIKRHNLGLSTFTSNGRPWMLAHYQGFKEKEDAQAEERFLKTGFGRERKNFLLKTFIERHVDLGKRDRAV